MSEFLHMGGYAFYVWSAYGIMAVVLVANVALPLVNGRQLKRKLARQARFTRHTSGE